MQKLVEKRVLFYEPRYYWPINSWFQTWRQNRGVMPNEPYHCALKNKKVIKAHANEISRLWRWLYEKQRLEPWNRKQNIRFESQSSISTWIFEQRTAISSLLVEETIKWKSRDRFIAFYSDDGTRGFGPWFRSIRPSGEFLW